MGLRDIESELTIADQAVASARDQLKRRKYTDAEPLLEDAVRLKVKALGETHPDVIALNEELADVYFGNRKLNDCARLYENLLASSDEQVDVRIRRQIKIAKTQEKLEQIDSAITSYKEAIDACERELTVGHPLTAIATESYSRLLRRCGYPIESIRVAEQLAGEARKKCLPSIRLSGMELFQKSVKQVESIEAATAANEGRLRMQQRLRAVALPILEAFTLMWICVLICAVAGGYQFDGLDILVKSDPYSPEPDSYFGSFTIPTLFTVPHDSVDELLLGIRTGASIWLILTLAFGAGYLWIARSTSKVDNHLLFPALAFADLFACALAPAASAVVFKFVFVGILFLWFWYAWTGASTGLIKTGIYLPPPMVCRTCGLKDYACKAPSLYKMSLNPQYWDEIMKKHRDRGEELEWFEILENRSF